MLRGFFMGLSGNRSMRHRGNKHLAARLGMHLHRWTPGALPTEIKCTMLRLQHLDLSTMH